eukprot:NODE_140_length_16098_cov_0.678605.p14 type:complete len:162 gc:universal NODE_140_length_16098_cov_0.678605:1077-1562(+)
MNLIKVKDDKRGYCTVDLMKVYNSGTDDGWHSLILNGKQHGEIHLVLYFKPRPGMGQPGPPQQGYAPQQGYYQGQPPQGYYQQPPPQGYYQQGPPQGYYQQGPPPQGYYQQGPPPQGYYQQGPPGPNPGPYNQGPPGQGPTPYQQGPPPSHGNQYPGNYGR